MSSRLSRLLAPVALAAALVGPTLAAVIVVDDDGGAGVNFTDLPAAIAAASKNDLILVHPGNYSAFVLDKGIRILGLGPGVRVETGARVTSLLPKDVAVLAELEVRDLRINACEGAVILDAVSTIFEQQSSQSHSLSVSNCRDVRVLRSDLEGGTSTSNGRTTVSVGGSRLELVQSSVLGETGQGTDCGAGGDGGHGLRSTTGARLHVAASTIQGGAGGEVNYSCPAFCNQGAGDGGNGLVLVGASTLYLMGSPSHFIKGGFAGNGGACACDGYPGDGLIVDASTALYSGAQLLGGDAFCFGGGSPLVVTGGGNATQVFPDDPYLELQGQPGPTKQIRFVVWGQPGDQVVVYLGRRPEVIPLPGVMVEQLTSQERAFTLGTIPAGNTNKTFPFKVPAFLPQGFAFFAQGVVMRGGQQLRTNSVPVMLR